MQFLLSLNKTAGTSWSLGTNYYKIIIENPATFTALSPTVSPGVIDFEATPAFNSTRELGLIYMGDLHGNLWKLDFTTASAGVDLAGLTFSQLTAGTSHTPLFIAKDNAGNVQPISMSPSIASGPNRSNIILFGTGKYLESTDNNITPVRAQSFYAINDNDGTPTTIAGRDRLQAGTIAAGALTVPAFSWGRAASASDTTQRSGWYVDFVDAGERQISGMTLLGGKVAFGTIVPPQNLTDPCAGGGGNFYSVNIFSGAGTVEKSTVGLLGTPLALETTDSSTTMTSTDSTGRRTKTVTQRLLTTGATGNLISDTNVNTKVVLGRLSWRLINNYQELKNAP